MKKFGHILFCFLPMLLAVAIQFLVAIPCTGIAFLNALIQAPDGSDFMKVYTDFAFGLAKSNTYLSLISIFYSLASVLVFGFWYQKRFHALNVKQLPNHFNPGILLGLVLLVPGLQYLTTYLVSFTSALNPQWLENYEELFESAGLTDVSFLMAIYAVVLGPICEELIFRGVILSYAGREMPFIAANIFQAVLFGIFHMNMIQGVYACFLGVFFGYVYHKTKSIFPTMFLHILFNSWGLFAEEWFMYKYDTVAFFFLWLIVGILLTVFGVLSFKAGVRKLNPQSEPKVLTDSSDI